MKRTVGLLCGAMTAAMLAAVAGPLPEIGGVFNPFPEPTDAEKQKMVERAAQDLAYEAAANARTKTKAAERKARRTRKRLAAAVAGGIVWFVPRRYPSVEEPVIANTRAARRREQFGRL